MRAFLRDNNDELINAYITVRDESASLMRRMDEHLTNYKADRERYYYFVRSQNGPAADVQGAFGQDEQGLDEKEGAEGEGNWPSAQRHETDQRVGDRTGREGGEQGQMNTNKHG
jgi:hypothetical protein